MDYGQACRQTFIYRMTEGCPSSDRGSREDLKEQLGLKLESQTGPVPLLVIDHVEKLSEN